MSIVVSTAWLARVMADALAARGMLEQHRREVVDALLFGSLRGIDSHGVALFPAYLAELESGRAKLHPRFEYRRSRSAVARLDAGGALGIVAAFEATRAASSLAREHGVGLVVVANSNHFGAASCYATALAKAGFIGLALSNSDALVVPVHGTVPKIGTNPMSMSAPGKAGELFCADLATSQGTFLRSLAAWRDEQPVPPGVLADEDGRDVAESGKEPRALLPLGGHKGQCLGMMVSILCALLGEAPFDWEIPGWYDRSRVQPRGVSHLLLAIDVAGLTPDELFRARLSSYLQAFRSSPSLGSSSVRCPGDDEEEAAGLRSSQGVPIRQDDYRFLCELEHGGPFESQQPDPAR